MQPRTRTQRLGELILVLGLILTVTLALDAAPGGKGGGGKPPKDPPPPTGMANPEIVFNGGQGGLHLTDGTDVAFLFDGGRRAEISTDGTKVSFFWNDETQGSFSQTPHPRDGLYWIYTDGSSSEPTFITAAGPYWEYHTWGHSLAGEEYIIFVDFPIPDFTDEVDDVCDLWAVRPDGTGLVQLTNTPGVHEGYGNLAWSNDGRYLIAGQLDNGNFVAYLYELDANMQVVSAVPYTTVGGNMWFSPDDQWIVADSEAAFGTPEIIKYEFANPSNIIQMSDSVGWNMRPGEPGILNGDIVFVGSRDSSHVRKKNQQFYGRLFSMNFIDGSGLTEMLPGYADNQRGPGYRRSSGSGAPLARQASIDITAIKPFTARPPRTGPVDAADLVTLLGTWGNCPPPCPQADFNRDGTVDLDDLLMFLNPATRPALW